MANNHPPILSCRRAGTSTVTTLAAILLFRVLLVLLKHLSGNTDLLLIDSPDAELYLDGARWLLGAKTEILVGLEPVNTFPPLNFLFIAACLFIGGGNILAAELGMAFLGWLTVVGVFLIARELFNRKAAVFAALITGLYPPLVSNSMTLLSENLSTVLTVFAFYMLIRFLRTSRTVYILCFGVLWGILNMTRGGMHYYLIFIACFLFFRQRKAGWRCVLRSVSALLLSAYTTIFMIAAVLYPITGHLSLDSQNGIATLLHSTNRLVNPSGDYGSTGEIFFQINNAGEQWPPGTLIYSPEYMQKSSLQAYTEIAAYILEKPWLYLKMGLERISMLWSPNQQPIHILKILGQNRPRILVETACLALCLIYLFILCTALLALFSSKDVLRAPFVLFVLFNCALIFIASGHVRYRLPLMPFFIAYCAGFLTTLLPGGLFKKSLRSVPATALILLLLTNAAYRYRVNILPTPREITVNKIELCIELGFPQTALYLIEKAENNRRLNLGPDQQKRMNAAESAARQMLKASP